jgi:hypothetical protein
MVSPSPRKMPGPDARGKLDESWWQCGNRKAAAAADWHCRPRDPLTIPRAAEFGGNPVISMQIAAALRA